MWQSSATQGPASSDGQRFDSEPLPVDATQPKPVDASPQEVAPPLPPAASAAPVPAPMGTPAAPAMCSVAQAASTMGCEAADVEYLLSSAQITGRRMGAFVRLHTDSLHALPVTPVAEALRRHFLPPVSDAERLAAGLGGVPPPRVFTWLGVLSVTTRDLGTAIDAAGGALSFPIAVAEPSQLLQPEPPLAAPVEPPPVPVATVPEGYAPLDAVAATLGLSRADLEVLVGRGLLDAAALPEVASDASGSAYLHLARSAEALGAALISLPTACFQRFGIPPEDSESIDAVDTEAGKAGLQRIDRRGVVHYVASDFLSAMQDM